MTTRRQFIQKAIGGLVLLLAAPLLKAGWKPEPMPGAPDMMFDPMKSYACLYKYSAEKAALHDPTGRTGYYGLHYEESPPADVKAQAEQRIGFIVPERYRHRVVQTHLPPGFIDKHDPTGKTGYYGLHYRGIEEQFRIHPGPFEGLGK